MSECVCGHGDFLHFEGERIGWACNVAGCRCEELEYEGENIVSRRLRQLEYKLFGRLAIEDKLPVCSWREGMDADAMGWK